MVVSLVRPHLPETGASCLLCAYPPQRVLLLLSLAQMPSSSPGTADTDLSPVLIYPRPLTRLSPVNADRFPADGKLSLSMHPTGAAFLSLDSSFS